MDMKNLWMLLGLVAATQAFAQGNQSPKAAPPEVKVKDVNQAPMKYAGQDVTVSGKIDRIEGSDAFLLDGKGLFNSKILVVVDKRQQAGTTPSGTQPTATAPVIKEKQKVELTGKIQPMTVSNVEETYKPGLRPEVRAEVHETAVPVLIVPPSGIKIQG